MILSSLVLNAAAGFKKLRIYFLYLMCTTFSLLSLNVFVIDLLV